MRSEEEHIIENDQLRNTREKKERPNFKPRPLMVPVRVSHVAIGESSKELAKPNLWILAILAKSLSIHK